MFHIRLPLKTFYFLFYRFHAILINFIFVTSQLKLQNLQPVFTFLGCPVSLLYLSRWGENKVNEVSQEILISKLL